MEPLLPLGWAWGWACLGLALGCVWALGCACPGPVLVLLLALLGPGAGPVLVVAVMAIYHTFLCFFAGSVLIYLHQLEFARTFLSGVHVLASNTAGVIGSLRTT